MTTNVTDYPIGTEEWCAYQEGWATGDRTQNPYPRGSAEYTAWDRAWWDRSIPAAWGNYRA